jgi:hypothetical protein
VSFGDAEGGEGVADAIHADVAAFGDGEGALEGIGEIAEDFKHFGGGFVEELVGGELHAVGFGEGLAGLDAEEDFLGAGVGVAEVVAIIGSDKRNAGFLGKAEEIGVNALFDFEALILNFEEEIGFAEEVAEAVGRAAGVVEAIVEEGFVDFAAEAGGEADEAAGVLGEEVVINARAVVEAFKEAGGDELDEIAVAVFGFAEEEEVIGAAGGGVVARRIVGWAAIVAGAFGDVDFAADDGLDATSGGGVVEMGGGKEIAVVGDGDGGEAAAGGFLDEFGNFAGAVEEGEIGMEMKVDEAGGFHFGE